MVITANPTNIPKILWSNHNTEKKTRERRDEKLRTKSAKYIMINDSQLHDTLNNKKNRKNQYYPKSKSSNQIAES